MRWVWILVPGAYACSTPCKELAEQICRCESNQRAQQSCLLDLENRESDVAISEDQGEACQALLDTGDCSCDRLAAGDLQACGLALESPPDGR
jgi:hypothetical protein